MEPQMQGPLVPPELLRQRPKKSWLMPAGAGLAIGTVLGLVIGFSITGGSSSSGNALSDALEGSALNQDVIDQSVETCGIDPEGYNVLDGGAAIELDTEGEDYLDSGTSNLIAYYCMLNELGVPEVTQQKMGRTRALDGTQSDTWDSLQASWSYHPDTGVNVLIEGVK